MKWNEKIFRKNDIRGIYKKDFDLDFVKSLGPAFANFCSQLMDSGHERPVVALGHDCRLSSPEIVHHLAKSLALAGLEVRFLGMTPSPVCFFASHFLKDIHASIMVTASHNPKAFNGFKMIVNKESICDEKILKLKEMMKPLKMFPPGSLPSSSSTGSSVFPSRGSIIPFDIDPFYIQCISSNVVFPSEFMKQRIEIAIDCGNGASGPIAQKVFKVLPLNIKIHWLYAKPDGRFPHHHPESFPKEKSAGFTRDRAGKKLCFWCRF